MNFVMINALTSRTIGRYEPLHVLSDTASGDLRAWCQQPTTKRTGGPFVSDTLTDSEVEEAKALIADLLAEPGVNDAMRAQLTEEALHFIRVCAETARKICALDDVLTARRIMTEVTVWAIELRTQMGKEVVVVKRPKNTVDSFVR